VIELSEEQKKEEQQEDILTKLSMPGKTLSEATIQKQQEAETKNGDEPTRLGAVKEQKEVVAQPIEETPIEPEVAQTYPEPKEETEAMTYDPQLEEQPTTVIEALEQKPEQEQQEQTENILTKLTMPGKEVTSTTVEPEKETTESLTAGLPHDLDVDKVKSLAESIFNSDYIEKKKKD
tara:strand:+ start:40136 stop:40669 length:534 start_codon:yes stop_codon:yes gene_type:complete